MMSFSNYDVEEDEYDSIQKAISSLENLRTPWEEESRPVVIERITSLMAAFPFGIRFDNLAMQAKISVFVEALEGQPLWAIRKAVKRYITKDRIKLTQDGKAVEPSSGDFLEVVKSEVNTATRPLFLLKRAQIRKEAEEKEIDNSWMV